MSGIDEFSVEKTAISPSLPSRPSDSLPYGDLLHGSILSKKQAHYSQSQEQSLPNHGWKCREKIPTKLESIIWTKLSKFCPAVWSMFARGSPMLKHRLPEIWKSEGQVCFDETYSTITPVKLDQNSPNFAASFSRKLSIQRCQDERIWWSFSRENCHLAKATLTAIWQPSLWRFTARVNSVKEAGRLLTKSRAKPAKSWLKMSGKIFDKIRKYYLDKTPLILSGSLEHVARGFPHA